MYLSKEKKSPASVSTKVNIAIISIRRHLLPPFNIGVLSFTHLSGLKAVE